MSLLFWLYVSSISDPTQPQTRTIRPNVPVAVRNINQDLLIVGELPSVDVQIANAGQNGTDRNNVAPEPYVDLENAGPGATTVPVRIDNLENPNSLVIQPPQITVRLAEAQRTAFPVKLRFIAANTQSFDPANLRLSPDEVIVAGPRRSVDRVVEVRANVDLGSLSPDVAQAEKLSAVDRAGKTVNDVAIDPPEVLVRLPPPATSTPAP
jgi:YbbR domain-containing protein